MYSKTKNHDEIKSTSIILKFNDPKDGFTFDHLKKLREKAQNEGMSLHIYVTRILKKEAEKK